MFTSKPLAAKYRPLSKEKTRSLIRSAVKAELNKSQAAIEKRLFIKMKRLGLSAG